jgi:hypothetical protein
MRSPSKATRSTTKAALMSCAIAGASALCAIRMWTGCRGESEFVAAGIDEPAVNVQRIIRELRATSMILRRAWGAKEFDESRQRDAQAHSANDQLENIHSVERGERRPLLHIEQAECRDQKRNDDAGGDMAVAIAHLDPRNVSACYLPGEWGSSDSSAQSAADVQLFRPGRWSGRESAPLSQVLPRCAAIGCTWRCGRCARPNRS